MKMPLQVSLESKGTIGACNGVINSDRFEQLYEWLHFHTKLGVEGKTAGFARPELYGSYVKEKVESPAMKMTGITEIQWLTDTPRKGGKEVCPPGRAQHFL